MSDINVIHEVKSAMVDFKTAYDKRLKDIQTQVDAIDVANAQRHVADLPTKSLHAILQEDESVQRLIRDRKGSCIVNLSGGNSRLIERKTTLTSDVVGLTTTGVLAIDRIPGITPEARQRLMVRQALTARPTALQIVDFVKVTTPMHPASPQVEASDVGENAVVFTAVSERVRTIGTWIPATRQLLDDLTELAAFLQDSLTYYVDLEEEKQMLAGDGTGVNLAGFIPQAAAFDTSLLSHAWTKIDIVGSAMAQLAIAKEIDPTFTVLNPVDWWQMRLTKDSFGRYILGDPQSVAAPSLFGMRVISTTNIAAGTFLVGSGNPAASEIRDRMETQVEISTSHADFFVKSLLAIRAEKRLALIVKRPGSFITGTFTTSP